MPILEIYAHRGASGYALENTWEAFYKAAEWGVGIELDVQITRDGVVVVYHDAHLKRLAGLDREIEQTDYGLLKTLKIGKKLSRRLCYHEIPLAYEVFQWAKEKQVPLNIEMKSSFACHPEGPKILASLLEGMKNFHLSSFDPHLLKEMKQLIPKVELALIINKKVPIAVLGKMDWIDSIHLHKRLCSPAFLRTLYSMDKTLRVYGIRGSEWMMKKRVPELKGIITDYPDRILKKLRLPSER